MNLDVLLLKLLPRFPETIRLIFQSRRDNNLIITYVVKTLILSYFFFGPLVLFVHEDVTTSKHFPYYWPFVRGIHRLPVDSPHKWSVMGGFGASFVVRHEQVVDQTDQLPVIWDTTMLMWRHYKACLLPVLSVNNVTAGSLLLNIYRQYSSLDLNLCVKLTPLLTHWGRVTHICVGKRYHHWFR